MFTDEHRAIVWDQLRQRDSKGLSRFLTVDLLQKAAKRANVAVGRGPLDILNLVWLGILGALHTAKNFADVLTITLKLLSDQEGFEQTPLGKKTRQPGKSKTGRSKTGKSKTGRSKTGKSKANAKDKKAAKARRSRHDPRQDGVGVSEEAYVKARQKMPLDYWLGLLFLLHERFEAQHPEQGCWKGFRLLALDGTLIDLPNWKRLREHYGSSHKGKGREKTQARMVMLQMPLLRLPYAYRVAPLSQGESTLALELLKQVYKNDLLLIDRGFFSYGLLARIHQQGAYFGIRLKKGIPLKRVRSLGQKDQLVRWRPSKVRQKGKGLPAQLQLRLIRYQVRGYRASAILTNANDPKRITREDWVRVATQSAAGRTLEPGLYHRRWEIETTFYELKVTQGMEGSLRSRTPNSLEYEIAAHVLLYFLVRWLMVEAAAEKGCDPLRLSFVHACRTLMDCKQSLLLASPRWAKVLLERMLADIGSRLVPLRPGRHYPRPNDGKPKNRGHGQKQPPAKLKRAA